MPKPLTRPQPTSSVAGMLEPAVTMQVMAKPEARPATIVAMPIANQASPQERNGRPLRPSGEIACIPRQFTLTDSADQTLKRLVATYSEATGLELKRSELLRAVLVAVEHAMPELTREAGHIGELKRPKNDRGNEALRDTLERRIAIAFVAGMRAAGVMPE